MSNKLKSTVFGALAVLAAVAGVTGAAEAHGKKKFGIFLGPPVHDCDFYYWKWQTTGKYQWQYRYLT